MFHSWRYQSSGSRQRVVGKAVPGVLTALQSFTMQDTTRPTTQCCIPQDWKRQQHRWKNLRSHQVTSALFHQLNFTQVTVITRNKMTQKYCKEHISIVQNIEEYSLLGCDSTRSGRNLLCSRMCKYPSQCVASHPKDRILHMHCNEILRYHVTDLNEEFIGNLAVLLEVTHILEE